MRRSRILILAVALFGASCASAPSTADPDPPLPVVVATSAPPAPQSTDEPEVPTIVERVDWADRFAGLGVEGTFVLRGVGATETEAHDASGAVQASLPASTFKIVSSLIALETRVVADVDDVAPWDGVERSQPAWNQDQTLRSAFAVSAVWRYQEIVRQIGPEAMADWVERLGYGNADIAGGIDRFWLDGALRVSPMDQLDLVEGLVTGALPFRSEVQSAVRDIFVREQGDGWVWSHKSGATAGQAPDVSWLVGSTEWDGDQRVFALRIERDGTGAPDRQAIEAFVRALLVEEGALPAP